MNQERRVYWASIQPGLLPSVRVSLAPVSHHSLTVWIVEEHEKYPQVNGYAEEALTAPLDQMLAKQRERREVLSHFRNINYSTKNRNGHPCKPCPYEM